MNILKIMGPWRLKHILVDRIVVFKWFAVQMQFIRTAGHVIVSTVKRETAVKPHPPQEAEHM